MTCTTALDSLNFLSLIFVIRHSLIPSLIPKLALDVKPGLMETSDVLWILVFQRQS